MSGVACDQGGFETELRFDLRGETRRARPVASSCAVKDCDIHVLLLHVACVRRAVMIGFMLELPVASPDAGQRLDRYLRKLLKTMPLAVIFKSLRSGSIRVDGKKAEPDLRIEAGMRLSFRLPERDLDLVRAAAERRPHPPGGSGATRDVVRAGKGEVERRGADRRSASGRARAPTVLYRDAEVMVVDKPAGMASQPGTGQDDADLCSWLDRNARELRTATFAPAPAHRIDRGTSGVVAIGLTPNGLRGLAAAFRDGTARKVYLAVVHGIPSPRTGTIDAPLLVVDAVRRDAQKVRVDRRGQTARTDYEVLAIRGERALLRLVLHTGRMHQIRAHLAHLGHPIVGDVRYGSTAKRLDAFLLHAAELTLPHPASGQPLRVVAPEPPEFRF